MGRRRGKKKKVDPVKPAVSKRIRPSIPAFITNIPIIVYIVLIASFAIAMYLYATYEEPIDPRTDYPIEVVFRYNNLSKEFQIGRTKFPEIDNLPPPPR